MCRVPWCAGGRACESVDCILFSETGSAREASRHDAVCATLGGPIFEYSYLTELFVRQYFDVVDGWCRRRVGSWRA